MSFIPIFPAPDPVDSDLTDPSCVGPELARFAQDWLGVPRALIWQHPSPDWPTLAILLPLATRLSFLSNPIFGRLARDWGMGLRLLGVDREGALHDFRDLLDAGRLGRLLGALARLSAHPEGRAALMGNPSTVDRNGHETLDTIFALLAPDMLTMLDARDTPEQRHLATEGTLTRSVQRHPMPGQDGQHSLFARNRRIADLRARLGQGLRDGSLAPTLYGLILRSFERREEEAELDTLLCLCAHLDGTLLAALRRLPIGAHAGCYNWVHAHPELQAHRLSVLRALPITAQFLVERLVPGPLRPRRQVWQDHIAGDTMATPDITQHALQRLSAAIDSGQSSSVVVALAAYFGVPANTLRALWRQCPPELGTPAEWHLAAILRTLAIQPARYWPDTAAGWRALSLQALPAALSSGEERS